MKTGHKFAIFAKTFKKGFNSAEKRTQKLVSNDLFFKNFAVFCFAFIIGILAGKTINTINSSSATSIPEAAPSIEKTTISKKSSPEKASIKTISSNNASAKKYTAYATTSTTSAITGNASATQKDLYIPKIGLNESVISTPNAETPAYNVGQYGNLFIGHNTGVFRNLSLLSPGDKITAHGKTYTVYASGVYAVSDDMKRVGDYSTVKLGYGMGSDLVLMTCTGQYNDKTSMSHRILIFAHLD